MPPGKSKALPETRTSMSIPMSKLRGMEWLALLSRACAKGFGKENLSLTKTICMLLMFCAAAD